jgi:hypothetical protein
VGHAADIHFRYLCLNQQDTPYCLPYSAEGDALVFVSGYAGQAATVRLFNSTASVPVGPLSSSPLLGLMGWHCCPRATAARRIGATFVREHHSGLDARGLEGPSVRASLGSSCCCTVF